MTTTTTTTGPATAPDPWWARAARRVLLLDEPAIARGLADLAAVRRAPPPGPVGDAVRRGVPAQLPNPWQVALGILRMQHRLVFRTATVGVAAAPRLPGLLPWLLERQALRAPLLLLDGSVVPGDLSGLRSSPTTLTRHLLGTFHAGREANYDLELLAARAPTTLLALRDACAAVVDGTHAHTTRWRRLCVYAGAHEALLPQIDAAMQGTFLGVPAGDRDDDDEHGPDVSFFAFLRFCARQPRCATSTWAAWRGGAYVVATGVRGGRA